MEIRIPELALVVLVGASGSGKSTFARTHFKPTEVLSSDYCRGLVSDDENDQSATKDAFEVLHFIASKRLRAGKLTVVDATNVQAEARKPLIALARQHHCLPVALVLDMPERLCRERNAARADRAFGEHVIRNQASQLRKSIRGLEREGFRHVHVFRSPEELEGLTIRREPLWNDKKAEKGPFDIIGDIHGCLTETLELLALLGYDVSLRDGHYAVSHPQGRKVVFVGDLVDRGPDSPGVVRLVSDVVRSGTGYCVAGNHDVKLSRALRGRDVKISHGLAESLEQLKGESEEFRRFTAEFLDQLVSHYVFDDGKLVVAHAGLREEMHGRGSGAVRQFALYGETTGETDEYGLPVRYNWAADYRGKAMVVYGHTPVPEAEWLNNTICLDTGCVFGGKLTALRYPERELVSVPARKMYYELIRPLRPAVPAILTAQQAHEELLDLEDVFGKRIVDTRLYRSITIREENAAAALEVMSRFAANPKWLIYLPPTMSPSETSARPGLLEHPEEALGYYAKNGVQAVVCEEKHMGSRAVVVICRDEDAARTRFGVAGEGRGIVYTRTGRRFFANDALQSELLDRIGRALDAAQFWERFDTSWFCLDCEVMPWSVKAEDLLRVQYAPTGTAARTALAAASELLRNAAARNLDVEDIAKSFAERSELVQRYVTAYRHYCWPVNSVADIKVAPFHLLATEGRTYFDQTHRWHMETLGDLARHDPECLVATPVRIVDVADANAVQGLFAWWEALTGSGGEGIVVKPMDFIPRGPRGLLQPAIKSRGPEYLRIIYGPEYSRPELLERLRERGLSTKRSMALREFALGVEGLERFVQREPLRRVRECVFGVLAMESEPVDPRL
ncbi:MAG: polynucleotide kinase-phosphatase [Steroidobacteraceae bacterium]|nr:polynucleotide kinase-phosphatase [Steroidobacteraceae bacterium]